MQGALFCGTTKTEKSKLIMSLAERGSTWAGQSMEVKWPVEKTQNMVNSNMGLMFKGYAPFVAAIIGISAFSSLMSLLGVFPPTSDINIVGGWAILVFILIGCRASGASIERVAVGVELGTI